MTALADNIATAFRNPDIAIEYAGWVIRRLITKGSPVRKSHGIRLGGFNGFSEYHSAIRGVSIDELAFIEHHPFDDGVVIDVGANLGLFSLLVTRRFADRRVIAFEPNPSTFSALKQNILRNGANHVDCRQDAITDKDGFVMFSASEHARANASISSSGAQASAGEIRVSCTTLDTFCAAHAIRRIALLKVDVEGYESLVFRGAATVLSDIRPGVIYFEVCPDLTRAAGFEAAGPARYLADRGYALHRVGAGGGLHTVHAEAASAVARVENWVAIDSR
jgi:FkbM family methyltransferase